MHTLTRDQTRGKNSTTKYYNAGSICLNIWAPMKNSNLAALIKYYLNWMNETIEGQWTSKEAIQKQ